MRVFLDTNVLVSAFATRGLSADVYRAVLMDHELVTGEVNLVELRRVLRGKLKVPAETVAAIEALLCEQTIIAKPSAAASVAVRDPDDVWVLASAETSGADVLVTGDKDLLDLAGEAKVTIMSPRGFWELLSDRKK